MLYQQAILASVTWSNTWTRHGYLVGMLTTCNCSKIVPGVTWSHTSPHTGLLWVCKLTTSNCSANCIWIYLIRYLIQAWVPVQFQQEASGVTWSDKSSDTGRCALWVCQLTTCNFKKNIIWYYLITSSTNRSLVDLLTDRLSLFSKQYLVLPDWRPQPPAGSLWVC